MYPIAATDVEAAFDAIDKERFGAAHFAFDDSVFRWWPAPSSGLLSDWRIAVGGGRWRILRSGDCNMNEPRKSPRWMGVGPNPRWCGFPHLKIRTKD